MSGDRHNFAFRAASFRKASRSSLSQTMRRAIRQPRFIAPSAKLVAEPGIAERLPKLRHDKLQLALRASRKDLPVAQVNVRFGQSKAPKRSRTYRKP